MKSTYIIIIVLVSFVAALITLGLYRENELDKELIAAHNQIKSLDAKAYVDRLEVVKNAAKKATNRINELAEIQRNNFRTKFIEAVRTMQPKLDKDVAAKIVKYIIEASETKGLDPILIAALVWTESRFDPFARSNKNAVGLMQIRYSVWKKTPVMLKNGARKEGSLFWIDINIKVGTGIFKEYYDKSGHDIAKTLWRYNSGQTKLPKGKRSYEISYVNKVLLKAYEIKEMLRGTKTNV